MKKQQQDIGLAVESGEYYRDALRWYSTLYHSPIGERALLIIVAVMAAIVTFMTVVSLFMLLPIVETKAMIVRVPQSLDRVAKVQPLMEKPRDDPNKAVMNWFVENFVNVRESYDIDKQERYNVRVWVLSSPKVYSEYSSLYKSNESPTRLYERHTKRTIEVNGIRINNISSEGHVDDSPAETISVNSTVQFTATESNSREDRKSLWSADITFRYSKIHVNQETGELTPMEFKVTSYTSKQLGLE